MTNLQIIDTVEGGHFVFKQNDYLLDEGVYSELYCALFATRSPEWLGDNAFGLDTVKVSSQTENAIYTYSSFTDANISLIEKAILNDLDRLTTKNIEIIIKELYLEVVNSKRLNIWIEIEGNSDAYQFIVDKTEVSFNNLEDISDCIQEVNAISGGTGIGISGGAGVAVGY